jgi:hypothetical protein
MPPRPRKKARRTPPPSKADAAALAQAAVDVEQIVSNIERGDCPQPVEKVWLVAHRDVDDDCHPVDRLSHVQVIVGLDHARYCLGDAELGISPVAYYGFDRGSADAVLLRDMCKAGFLGDAAGALGIGDWAGAAESEVLDGAAVANAMVDAAVEQAWDNETFVAKGTGEAARLKSLFGVWLTGATWGQCGEMHALHTGQMGMPWECRWIMEQCGCGLRRGLPLPLPPWGGGAPRAETRSGGCFRGQCFGQQRDSPRITETTDDTPERVADACQSWAASPEFFVQIWSSSASLEEGGGRGESAGAAEAIGASLAAQRAADERLAASPEAREQAHADFQKKLGAMYGVSQDELALLGAGLQEAKRQRQSQSRT